VPKILDDGTKIQTTMTTLRAEILPDGTEATTWQLRNAAGMSARVLNYGAILTHLFVPDRQGVFEDVVLGFDTLDPYRRNSPYFGAMVGRVAGRIPGGVIRVDGRDYQLSLNEGANHLHGGFHGIDRRAWRGEVVPAGDGSVGFRLVCDSADGEEGYPGHLRVTVTYTLTASNELVVETEAESDRATPVSLTHHSYFNLGGEASGPVLEHWIRIPAEEYVACDAAMTPLGRREAVAGQAADLRATSRLGDVVPSLFHQHGDLYLLPGDGATDTVSRLRTAAEVGHPGSGRVLKVRTSEECVQFYTGACLDGSFVGKSGKTYDRFGGLCVECQGYPGATTASGFRDILARPGHPRKSTTVYAFTTD
jgi:aldose 1-epimerase